ncbi:hypothetical protein [Aeoliella sp. SH292]|uniref:hypothetical protein n=1 Tax=Aeoliella sp. SH292 TaxID=3454464 RepID=UPI003F978AF3
MNITSYDELLAFLRTTDTVSGGDIYDESGVFELLAACVDNLSRHVHDECIEDQAVCFTDGQKEFLRKVISYF